MLTLDKQGGVSDFSGTLQSTADCAGILTLHAGDLVVHLTGRGLGQLQTGLLPPVSGRQANNWPRRRTTPVVPGTDDVDP